METKNFRSVAFGGFDKEEVIAYIQQTAQENTTAQEALQKELSNLRAENETLKSEAEALRQKAETAGKAELARLEEENRALAQQLAAALPDAEAYAKIKAEVGDIECQARKRACDLEESTSVRMEAMLAALRLQYQELTDTFRVANAHVTAELRKAEVTLSQMPRALDQAGAELDAMEAMLHSGKTESQ